MSAPTEKHRDEIDVLSPIFYIRWTSGPNYERAFLCVEDGEPDMNSFAEVSFGQAHIFKQAVFAALAAAEERGMKRGLERAAEIAQEPVITGNQNAIEACVDFMEAWEMGADDTIDGIVKCILLQVEIDQSPATTSPQATPAGEGASFPSSPAPIHDEARHD